MFTCNSCATQFKSGELQRYHMKTDWHRYNLKRRVLQLPPVSADDFAERAQLSAIEQEAHQLDEFGFPVLKPIPGLDKTSHHKSSKHRGRSEKSKNKGKNEIEEDRERSASPADSVSSRTSKSSQDANTDYGEDTASEYGFTSDSNYDTSEIDYSDESDTGDLATEELKPTDCIFCGSRFKELERNVKHMFTKHGLYIPDRTYLVDLEGLLNFLIEVIIEELLCPCCNFKGTSVESIRSHLNDKRHCFMPYETTRQRAVFENFYDYSLAVEEKKEPKQTTKPGKSLRFKDPSPQPVKKEFVPKRRSPPPTSVVASASDKRLASGITERQFTQGLKKMQQLEKRAINQQIRRDKTKKVNFQAHFRDELLQ